MEQVCKSEGRREERAAWGLPDFLPPSTLFQDPLLTLGCGDGGAGSKKSSQQGEGMDENRFLVSHSCIEARF